ncbi:hypothetical protein F5613_001888 [Macellibacteroides fermentans]|uniref:Formiminotransferase N-terminal subdomain domain-containing protein n=1 Tax=Macellibacteroides fermentans TaxID=879969 RepID=A0A8E2A1H8_9PORP|nr:hypothetical protein [Macellibacteroides fermentans]
MEKRIVECVPNFSEGRDMSVIKQITDSIEGVAGVKLLDVDPGWATNRTVVTFVGEVEAVVEAAFLCVVKAAQLIDMRKHHGEHPRMRVCQNRHTLVLCTKVELSQARPLLFPRVFVTLGFQNSYDKVTFSPVYIQPNASFSEPD